MRRLRKTNKVCTCDYIVSWEVLIYLEESQTGRVVKHGSCGVLKSKPGDGNETQLPTKAVLDYNHMKALTTLRDAIRELPRHSCKQVTDTLMLLIDLRLSQARAEGKI